MYYYSLLVNTISFNDFLRSLQDLLVLLIFTVTITVIVYLHIPKETYYVTKTVKDVLVQSAYADGTPVEEVNKWLNTCVMASFAYRDCDVFDTHVLRLLL